MSNDSAVAARRAKLALISEKQPPQNVDEMLKRILECKLTIEKNRMSEHGRERAEFKEENMKLRKELEEEKMKVMVSLELRAEVEEDNKKRREELIMEKLEMMAKFEEENMKLRKELEKKVAVPICEVCCFEYNTLGRIPRILSCGHTVCEECIGKLRVKITLTCPLDRKEMFVNKGVIGLGLPRNFAIIQMIERR